MITAICSKLFSGNNQVKIHPEQLSCCANNRKLKLNLCDDPCARIYEKCREPGAYDKYNRTLMAISTP